MLSFLNILCGIKGFLKKGQRGLTPKVGRIHIAFPGSGAKYYLHMLLNISLEPCSYADIQTVDGVLYLARLLDDDKQ